MLSGEYDEWVEPSDREDAKELVAIAILLALLYLVPIKRKVSSFLSRIIH